VVICDDVSDFRDLLSVALHHASGIELAGQAANGREAIEVVRAERPDVVLLDIAMPVMDGMEALPQILSASPDSKVIMLTGFSSADVRARALASGATAYLEKGVRPAALVEAIRAACEGQLRPQPG